jgi:hypothetical protein
MIFQPMVRLAYTMLQSCVKISTISKWIETSFHLSLDNLAYHRVHPKWFLTLCYVWRKPCTYLAPTLTPSWNGSKQDSTWATSPRSSIGFIQNDFQAYGTFGANCASILHRPYQRFQTGRYKIRHDPRHLGVPSCASKMIAELMVRST